MSGRRKFARERCGGCGLHTELCVCASLPRVEVSTEFLVVQHNRERGKPTNSARLIPMVLPSASIVRYAVRGEEFDPAPLRADDCDYLLLFPGAESRELRAEDVKAAPGRRRVIVLLDGSWGQCSRMSHRVPGVPDLPQVRLPPGPPGRWGVRTTNDPSRLCSFEAAIRCVQLLHGAGPAEEMQNFFDRLTARMLFMKAKLRSPEVPSEWKSE